MNGQHLETLAKKMTHLELAIRASEQVNFLHMMASSPEKKQDTNGRAYEVAVLLEEARSDVADYILYLVNGEQNVN